MRRALQQKACAWCPQGVLVYCGLVVALAISVCFASISFAWAEEQELNNNVNPQQLPDSSFIYDTSIDDLGSADAYYNGQTVQVTGEVIGDNIKADATGNHRWIVLTSREASSSANITVYMTAESAERIDTFGAYGKTGTMLRVRGVFNLTCADHDGLTDVHAEHVTVSQKGEVAVVAFEIKEFIPGAITCGIGLLLFGLFYFMRERRR